MERDILKEADEFSIGEAIAMTTPVLSAFLRNLSESEFVVRPIRQGRYGSNNDLPPDKYGNNYFIKQTIRIKSNRKL